MAVATTAPETTYAPNDPTPASAAVKGVGDLTKLQEGDSVDLGAAGSFSKTPDGSYEPVVLSTKQGAADVVQGNATLDKLSGTNPNADPNSNNPGKNVTYDPKNPYNLNPDGTPKTGTGNFADSSMPGNNNAAGGAGAGGAAAAGASVTYVNPATGEKQTLDPTSMTPDQLRTILGNGFKLTESSGAVPSWVTAGDPDLGQANKDLADLTKTFNDLKAGLSQFTVSDADLKAQTDAISAQWDARIATMKDVNVRREKSINTLGIRMGSQYTGGSGGVFGGIVSEEERQGVQRIADLESQKQAAISAAKDAARTKNWDVYNTQLGLAEKAYTAKLDEVTKLNQSVTDANKKAQDQATQASREGAIADLIGQGVSDPQTLLNYLNYNDKGAQVGDFTIDEITKTMKALLPNGLDDIVKTAAQNGAPADVIQSIMSSSSVAGAYSAAGQYIQGGTGIVAEYQYYARQAMAAGQTPVDFNTYQNIDAGRKASIAAANKAATTGDTVQNLAQQLVTGMLAPSELSKRSTGVGSYSDILAAADKYSMLTTGKHFNIATADRDYKFANNPNTQNTLNYLISLTGSDDGTGKLTGGNLQELQNLSDKIDRTDFPALNDAAAWAKLSSGSVDIASYQAVATEVADQVAKILQGGTSGGGTSDAKLTQAANMFRTGFSKAQLAGVISSLGPLLQNRAKGIIQDNAYLQDYAQQLGVGQSATANAVIKQETDAQNAVVQYGKDHPDQQQTIKGLVGEINPDTGQAYTYSDVAQILGIQ